MGYDEQSSINYIRHSTGDLLAAYDDDQILNIIDMVWDWQDANGFLDIDAGADAPEINVADVVAYCRRMLGRCLSTTSRRRKRRSPSPSMQRGARKRLTKF